MATPTPTPMAGDARLHIDAAQIAVGDFIGEGASGQVYAGVWRPGGTFRRDIALKFLPEIASLAAGSAARQKVDAEMRIMQLASEKCGAGACELLGTSVLVPAPGAPPRFCIVMKLYAGGSLAHLLGEGPLERARATRFAAQLCRAVAKLHRSEEHGGAGILLRDIKPQNVLLDDETDALAVADFGISHLLTHTAYVPTSAAGTFNYMAPEAINEELGEIGRGSDVWSLGCVLGQLFGAPMPFAGNNMMQIYTKVVVKHRAPAVPEDAPQAALLRRCFAYAAAERPSAAELCGAFTPDTAPRECELCGDEFAPSAGSLCDSSVEVSRCLRGTLPLYMFVLMVHPAPGWSALVPVRVRSEHQSCVAGPCAHSEGRYVRLCRTSATFCAWRVCASASRTSAPRAAASSVSCRRPTPQQRAARRESCRA